MNLKISEVFYSIQGEGKTIGTPSVFISLKGCNLLCKGDWECDAIDVWKNGNELKKNEFSTIMKKYIHKLEEGSHLILSWFIILNLLLKLKQMEQLCQLMT